ncbi:PP2C family protein-serine/threonine phosphatase [Streptomyces sp. NPDC051207]|uniref:PP2C family protein-serine/threonine phosphatase n=1 Tax=Streptomyces sp. NPDC051207 TaxID=3154641 RepID=UPI00341D6464
MGRSCPPGPSTPASHLQHGPRARLRARPHRPLLHAAVLDALGPDLQAGLTSSVALDASGNTRRRGADLTETVHNFDQALADAFPDRYVTAVLSHLDLITGHLTWVNCGHPTPLLIRGTEVVHGAMERPSELPLGLLGALQPDNACTIHHSQLEPGDRVLLYTDGVTDARSRIGERFGEGGFATFSSAPWPPTKPPPRPCAASCTPSSPTNSEASSGMTPPSSCSNGTLQPRPAPGPPRLTAPSHTTQR